MDLNKTVEEVKFDPLVTNILLMIHNWDRSVRPVEIDRELRVGSRLFRTLTKMQNLRLIEKTAERKKFSAYGLTETGMKVLEQLLPSHEEVREIKTAEEELMSIFFNFFIKEKYGRPEKVNRIKRALRVRSEVQKQASAFLRDKGFIEIPPVIISPITDPLRKITQEAEIEYYGGQKYRLTQSMIFHKQIAICSLGKIFTFSPNVRLESPDLADTGRHLVEFTQLDLEVKGASRSDMIKLAEQLLIHILSCVKRECREELEYFNRHTGLQIPHVGFEQLEYKEEKKKEKYRGGGSDFITILSHERKEPFWIIDFPIESREFYDRENPMKKGVLVDMDLILPEGFGEVLSGGEREYTYDRLLERLKKSHLRPSEYRLYLWFAKWGFQPSAGFGFGIERLVRFICGLRHIDETTFFAKIPGEMFCL